MRNKKRVLFVCLGNICRSPLAEGIFKKKIEDRGLLEKFEVDSCGTSNYHIGELPDPRTRENAVSNGVILDHRARQLTKEDIVDFDHIFVMDRSNLSSTLRLSPGGEANIKIKLLRDFDPLDPGMDVPDPYYGGSKGFQNVFEIIDRSLENWLNNMN